MTVTDAQQQNEDLFYGLAITWSIIGGLLILFLIYIRRAIALVVAIFQEVGVLNALACGPGAFRLCVASWRTCPVAAAAYLLPAGCARTCLLRFVADSVDAAAPARLCDQATKVIEAMPIILFFPLFAFAESLLVLAYFLWNK